MLSYSFPQRSVIFMDDKNKVHPSSVGGFYLTGKHVKTIWFIFKCTKTHNIQPSHQMMNENKFKWKT